MIDKRSRSILKRIFCAGEASRQIIESGFMHIPCNNWNLAYQQGLIAAYNILGLVSII